jgi:trehalose/maltose transport system substrate-binding protein
VLDGVKARRRDAGRGGTLAQSRHNLANVKDAELVARPSSQAGARYNEVSIAFFQAGSRALQGKDPKEVLGQGEQCIQRAMR